MGVLDLPAPPYRITQLPDHPDLYATFRFAVDAELIAVRRTGVVQGPALQRLAQDEEVLQVWETLWRTVTEHRDTTGLRPSAKRLHEWAGDTTPRVVGALYCHDHGIDVRSLIFPLADALVSDAGAPVRAAGDGAAAAWQARHDPFDDGLDNEDYDQEDFDLQEDDEIDPAEVLPQVAAGMLGADLVDLSELGAVPLAGRVWAVSGRLSRSPPPSRSGGLAG